MTRLEPQDKGRDIARWIVFLPAAALAYLLVPRILSGIVNFAAATIGGPMAPAFIFELGILAVGCAAAVYVGAWTAPRFHFSVGCGIAGVILVWLVGLLVAAGMAGLLNWQYVVGALVQAAGAILAAVSLSDQK